MTSSEEGQRLAELSEAVRETIAALTRAWLEGRFDELAGYFHPEVVVVAPGGAGRAEGREACVASYREFMTIAVVHEFVPEPPQVDAWESAAVALCPFTIAYEMGGAEYREKGTDLLVLTNEAGAWQVRWRTMISQESSAGGA